MSKYLVYVGRFDGARLVWNREPVGWIFALGAGDQCAIAAVRREYRLGFGVAVRLVYAQAAITRVLGQRDRAQREGVRLTWSQVWRLTHNQRRKTKALRLEYAAPLHSPGGVGLL